MFNKVWIRVFALTVVATILMCANMAKAQLITDGLVSYYTMDKKDIEGETLKDVFGDNDGTIIGEQKSVKGHLGEALEFNEGPDCVELPPLFNIGEDSVTYETWFSKSATVDWQYLIVNKTDFGDNFFRLGFNQDTGQVRMYTEQDNGTKNAFVTSEDYADGNWHQVVATREGNVARIYVDTELVKEDVAMEGDIGGDDTSWYLAQDGNNAGHLTGAMDEVRIYSRALTEEEIQQNFESEGMAVVDSKNKLSITWGMIKEKL